MVFFVSCLYSAVSLTRVREWRFIIRIIDHYYWRFIKTIHYNYYLYQSDLYERICTPPPPHTHTHTRPFPLAVFTTKNQKQDGNDQVACRGIGVARVHCKQTSKLMIIYILKCEINTTLFGRKMGLREVY